MARLWTPADMSGATGLEYFDSTQNVQTSGASVTSWTAIRPGGGMANVATTVRDDYRPALGQVNGQQSVYFDPGTRRLALAADNLPVGTANKFWFMASMILEARAGDFYPWGYGSNQGSGVTWKTRRGTVPSSDVGNNGYSIGTTPIAATGISIIVEAYREAGPLSRGWYNGQASPSTYAGARPTSTARGAALGYWPEYGGGAEQHLLRLGYAYGEPSADDLRRLEGWLSWNTGDNGASLAAGHPYKAVAPMADDGTVSAAPDTAYHLHQAGMPSLAARSIVQPSSASHSQVAASATTAARFTAQPEAAFHGQVLTSPSAMVLAFIAPDAASHALIAAEPSIAARASAIVNGAVDPQIATQPMLAVAGMLMANDALHAQAATSPALSPRAIVMPGPASQAHRATQPAIGAAGSAMVASALHVQAVTSPAVHLSQAIAVASARHQHAATTPAITALARISPASASHGHPATPAPLFVGTRPPPPSSRTVKSEVAIRLVRSPRFSRLAA